MCSFSTMNWPNSSNTLYLLSVWLHHSIYPGVIWWDSGESVLKWFSMLDASDVGAEQRSLVLDRDTRLLSEYSKCFNWRQIWWVRRPVSWLYVSWNVLIQPTNGCSRVWHLAPSCWKIPFFFSEKSFLSVILPAFEIRSNAGSLSWTGYCQCNIPSSFLLLVEWSEAELIHEQSFSPKPSQMDWISFDRSVEHCFPVNPTLYRFLNLAHKTLWMVIRQ